LIRRLVLDSFGKFRDTRFDFSDVTLFVGRNESGKTTIFDALFQETCQPKANKRHGRMLQERYGESRQARIEWAGESMSLDEDEFHNLLAIRSGNIHLDLTSGSAWMEKVKSSLFTGGIDPHSLQLSFAERASDKGSLKHNRDIKQLEKKLDELRDRLREKKENRDGLLSRERDTQKLNSKLEAAQTELETLKADINRIERELEYENKIQNKIKLANLLIKISSGEARQETLESLHHYSQEGLDRMDELASRVAQGELDAARAQAEHDHQMQQLKAKRSEVAGLEEVKTRDGNLSRLATEYLITIEHIRENLPRRKASWWHWLLLALLSGFVGASILLSLSQQNMLFFVISVGLGALLGVFYLLLMGRIRSHPDLKRIGNTVQRIKEEWRHRTGETSTLTSESPDGLMAELETLRSAADRGSEALRIAIEELHERERALEECKDRRIKILEQIQTGKREVADWLKAAEVRNRDEYYRKTLDRQRLKEEQLRWEEELAEELKSRSYDSVGLLRQECERRLTEFDRESIPNMGRSEEEIRRLDRELKERSARLKALAEEHRRTALIKAEQQGEISGSLGSLPQDISELEGSIMEIEESLKKMEIDKQAAGLVRDLFGEMAEDTENVFLQLGRELSSQFGELVPASREASLKALSTESLAVADAGGVPRRIEHLSSGTRDAFMLAARLALARRGHPEKALLILDEPFHALDGERVAKALAMIRKFQRETGWQVVLFSKESDIEARCREVFPESQLSVHPL
jgi:DNA repair exonuclease SbcCD ATPase subunit